MHALQSKYNILFVLFVHFFLDLRKTNISKQTIKTKADTLLKLFCI